MIDVCPHGAPPKDCATCITENLGILGVGLARQGQKHTVEILADAAKRIEALEAERDNLLAEKKAAQDVLVAVGAQHRLEMDAARDVIDAARAIGESGAIAHSPALEGNLARVLARYDALTKGGDANASSKE